MSLDQDNLSMTKELLIGFGLAIISGILLALAYLSIGLGFLMWFALVPLIVAGFKFACNPRQFGIFFGIAIAIWLEIYTWGLSEISWTRVAPLLISAIAVVITVPLKRLLERHNYHLFIPLIALMSVTIDLLASFTPAANVLSPATTQSFYPVIIQIASLLGIYSVTFLVIASNAIISLVILKLTEISEYRWQIIGGLVIISFSIIWGIIRLNHQPESSVPVAAVQGKNVNSLSRLIRESGAKLIVLPEGNFFISDESSYLTYEIMWKSIATGNNIYLVAPYLSLYQNRNMAVLVSPDGEISAPYAKYHIAKIVGEDWQGGSEFPVFHTEFGVMGIMICYDGYYPDVARRLAMQNACFIAMPSNSITPELSLRIPAAIIPFRAVENGVGIVMADVVYGSMIIDPFGRIIKRAPVETGVIIKDELSLIIHRTFYTKYGYWFPYFCLILLLCFITYIIRNGLKYEVR